MLYQLILEVLYIAITNPLPLILLLPFSLNSIFATIAILAQEEEQREAIAATDG